MAQVAPTITYQGKLTGVTNGLQTLEVNLYDAAIGGGRVWGPQMFDGTVGAGKGSQVVVIDGYFNIVLGPLDAANRLLTEYSAGSGVFLSLRWNGGAELLPRQQFHAVPQAHRAASADFAGRASGLIGSAGLYGGRTDILGYDEIGNHWLRAAQTDQELYLGFTRISDSERLIRLVAPVSSEGRFAFSGDRTNFSGYDGASRHWVRAADNDNEMFFSFVRISPTERRIDFTAPTTGISDITRKERIVTLESAVDKIKAIRGVRFHWRNDGMPTPVSGEDVGVIAQEVREVLPQAVFGEEGNLSVDYTRLIPLLVQSIKEQQTMIETLKARVEQLEKP